MPSTKAIIIAAAVAIATQMSGSPVRAQSLASSEGVHVDLEANDARVRIDELHPDGTTTPVCVAPCAKVLSRSSLYVIQGDGMPSTTPFTLPEDRRDLFLSVSAGSNAKRRFGIAAMAVGLPAMVVAFMFSPADAPPEEQRRVGAWPALLGLGSLVLTGVGAWLWWKGGTRVASSTGHSFTSAPPAVRRRYPALALTARGLEF